MYFFRTMILIIGEIMNNAKERLCQSYGSDPQIGARSVTPYQYPQTRRVKISFHSKNVFFGIAVRSWWESWQARKTNGKGGSGYVKNKSLSEMRQLSEEHVFVLTHCNVHPSSNICPAHLRAIRCQFLLSTCPTRNNLHFLYGDPKMLKSARA